MYYYRAVSSINKTTLVARWTRFCCVNLAGRTYSANVNANVVRQEDSEDPEYPPILDVSEEALQKRERQKWHDKIRNLGTVEEKLFEINMPKYYGWESLILKEGFDIPYNSLPFSQYITRTHFTSDLPGHYNLEVSSENDHVKNWLEKIKSNLEEALLFEYTNRREPECVNESGEPPSVIDAEDAATRSLLRQFNRVLLANLSVEYPHLLEAQVDYNPRIEAFWFARMRSEFKSEYEWKKDEKKPKDLDKPVQYIGSPLLQLRCDQPLPPVASIADSERLAKEVSYFPYDPRLFEMKFDRRFGTNIPGFWPGEKSEFGLLSFHSRSHVLKRPETYGEEDNIDALHSQAMLASFSWLYSQACYQGFSTFNDVTYPFVAQTVITNGQLWSFYVYQLNTMLLHSDAQDNPRCNVCWGTSPMKLFERIEDGKVEGLNEEVLQMLLKFYLTVPSVREGIELKPYLSKEKHIANVKDDERREWFEKRFKYMYSNRPRGYPPPEIYDWERIYKVEHETRPMDARRRFFELDIDPFERRVDQCRAEYIARADRTHRHIKYKKTYYP